MSTVSTSNQPSKVWVVAPYVISTVAAAGAFMPVGRLFAKKSSLQLIDAKPIDFKAFIQSSICKVRILNCHAIDNMRMSSTVGCIVGLQLAMQDALDWAFSHQDIQQQSLSAMLISPFIVACGSSPFLAAFNAQTMGGTVFEAIKKLSSKQFGAIAVREIAFLCSLRVSQPFGAYMKDSFGDNRTVGYTSVALTGVVGSLCGHPFDTALTRWQKGKPVICSFKPLMQGSIIRSTAMGCFYVCYTLCKEMLNGLSNNLK